jgi:MFS superfamily sulfate permease-like transporter
MIGIVAAVTLAAFVGAYFGAPHRESDAARNPADRRGGDHRPAPFRWWSSALAFFELDQRIEAYEAMFLLGVMVGVIQILIAVFKLGDLTRYISESVILGFMRGRPFCWRLAKSQFFSAFTTKGRAIGLI